MSAIHFIGGEKGGVGKSVVARLLAQYWIDKEIPWRGFDTDRSHGALLRYYRDFSEAVEISRLEDLDRLMESAAEGQGRVLVDLAAQTERDLYTWIDSGGVMELAEDIGLPLVFWHVMDDGKDSVQLLGRLLDRFGEAGRYVVVLNQGRGENFALFEESDARKVCAERSVPVLALKALHKPTMQKIDKLDKSFWAATQAQADQGLGLMERQRVKVWIKNAYRQFDDLSI